MQQLKDKDSLITDGKRFVDAKELSKITNLSRGAIYELVRRERIPCIKFSERRIRFDLQAVEAWLTQQGRSQAASKEAGDAK